MPQHKVMDRIDRRSQTYWDSLGGGGGKVDKDVFTRWVIGLQFGLWGDFI